MTEIERICCLNSKDTMKMYVIVLVNALADWDYFSGLGVQLSQCLSALVLEADFSDYIL